MSYLEEIDSRDHDDGTPRANRLRQVLRQTGRFIALLAAAAPEGNCVEIGTSAGYSTLWLGLACRQIGRRITTCEILPERGRVEVVAFAREVVRVTAVHPASCGGR
jgi:caffeoyl-CoA O-methyltransferase